MQKNANVCSLFKRKKYKVTLLKMKLITILFLAGTLSVSAISYSQATKIDLSLADSTSLGKILSSIEKTSEFIFIYDASIVNMNIKRTITAKEEKIEAVLEKLFQGTNLAWLIDDRQVFLYKEDDFKTIDLLIPKPSINIIPLQKREISGTVTDQKGIPVAGVTVVVKGTTIGVLTGADGKYSLGNVPQNAILVFSFIGFVTQEVPFTGQDRMDVLMKEEVTVLQEVVVIGYGVQKKESVVGSISQTTNKDLRQAGFVPNLAQALTGQLPGVISIQSTGEPGGSGIGGKGDSGSAVYIRGMNTWNGGQPLILVDGIERDMYNMDINEVENISVLKDASATAIFGVKGANGVILITTKRGSVGKMKLSFLYNTTAETISKLPEKMDSYNAILFTNEAITREVNISEASWKEYIPDEIVKRYKLPQDPEYVEIYPNVDWEKAMFDDVGWSQHATLNLQGGTSFANYFGSISYSHVGDIIKKYENFKPYDPNYNFDRFNYRTNFDFKLTKTTELKVNLSGMFSQKNTNYSYAVDAAGSNYTMWTAAYSFAPDLFIPQYSDGRYGVNMGKQLEVSPVATAQNVGLRHYKVTQLNSDFALEQNLDFITKGLSAKAQLYYDNSISSTGGVHEVTNGVQVDGQYSTTKLKYINSALYTGPDQDPSEYTTLYPTVGPQGSQYGWAPQSLSFENETILPQTSDRRMQYQFQLNYSRKFGIHNIGAMGVFKRQEYAYGSMFRHYTEDWILRTTYDYDTRYLFEMNGAYNGSEQFGPGYRFKLFPSVALGWVVSNEKFFKIKQINRLKLRYSVGMVGDDKVSGNRWLYSSQLSYGGSAQINARNRYNSPYTSYKESVVGNPEIHWEKALKTNYGAEMGLFNNLISLTYDYFTEDRTDILIEGGMRSIPDFFGATPPSANLGHVKAKGYELEIRFDKKYRRINYWVALAVSQSKNTVIYKDDPQLLSPYLKSEGYAINQTRSAIRSGRYNNWDEMYASIPTETYDLNKLPGYWDIIDFNADGIIKSKDDQIPKNYSNIPQNTYNFSLGSEYKGFSVMAQFYGVNNVTRSMVLNSFYDRTHIVFEHMSDYWSKDNQDASAYLPRWLSYGPTTGDFWLWDASYLRLKTVELSYTFQDKWLKKTGLPGARIYLNGNNLYIWTDLPDDRESDVMGGTASQGTYPNVKRTNLGIEITF